MWRSTVLESQRAARGLHGFLGVTSVFFFFRSFFLMVFGETMRFETSIDFFVRPMKKRGLHIYNIYIYMVTPPPWSTYKHFIWELPVFYAHFCLPEKWHSHVSISFTYYVSRRPRHTHTCNFVFVYFFVISWGFGQKPKKHWENQKKQKKQNCKTHVGTSWWVRVCNFVFFCFFWISRGFWYFWSKTQKTLRKPKKPKKTKLQDPCRYKLVS